MNKYIKFFIGLLISVLGLWYALRQFDWYEFINALKNVNYWYLFAVVIVQFIAMWARSLRWKWLLLPIREFPTAKLFDATMIGYFGNMVLPLRMGEVLRAYVLSNNYNVSTSKILGTLVIDRLLDLLALMVFTIFFLFNTDLLNIPQWAVILSIMLTISMFGIMIYIGGKNPDWSSIKKKYKVFNSNIGSRIFEIIANLISGLRVLKQTPKKFGVYGFIIVLWSLYYLSFILIVKAVDLNLTMIDIGVLYVLLTIVISSPAAPGSRRSPDAAPRPCPDRSA